MPGRAARSALRIVARVERDAARLLAERGLRLQVAIGVHTGTVVAPGALARGRGAASTTWSVRPPRPLSRLDQIARPGEVLVSLATRQLLRGDPLTEAVSRARTSGVEA